MLLAGDVGGTKTVLALYSAEAGPRHPHVKKTFSSGRYRTLEDLIRDFLQDRVETVTHAAFGVAGPVMKDQSRVTNLPWTISEEVLARNLGLESVHLLNDLKAIATAVPILEPEDLTVLNEGAANPYGAIAVIAPGTGLGEAYLVWSENGYRAQPSEGGHSDFAPADELQIDLLSYLHEKMHHVSFERVCSGIGIPNLYDFFKDTGRYPEPDWLGERLAAADDRTPVIAKTAEEKGVPICEATMDLFVTILAREAGNLALKVLATGGVYLGGGIPPRILPLLKNSDFVNCFASKGRFREMLVDIPIHVIENPQAALLGAAHDGLAMLSDDYQL